jgi:hypothetical protein
MNVIISVLSIDAHPFTELEKTIRETWATLNKPNYKIFYYYGNRGCGENRKNEIEGDRIFTGVPEIYDNIGYKTIKMFELIYENYEFDYIFRTNLSSYVDIENMVEYLKDKPLDKFYCGSFGEHAGIEFCSGSGYFLSKDLVKLVIENKETWNHSQVDDVSIGLLLSNLGIKRVLGRRYDFYSGAFLDLTNYHYRCKSNDSDRYGDITNMKSLYDLKK